MQSSLPDSAPKSIEQAENELFGYHSTQPVDMPADAAPAEPAPVPVDMPAREVTPESTEDASGLSTTIRERFEAQRQRIASELALIHDIRQTIARLREIVQKPSEAE